MRSIFLAEDLANKIPVPRWALPALGGLGIGIIAIYFPQVLGVGYGITESALLMELSLILLIVLGVLKILATAIS
jgi:Chloride channel protein EriC